MPWMAALEYNLRVEEAGMTIVPAAVHRPETQCQSIVVPVVAGLVPQLSVGVPVMGGRVG